MNKVVREWFDWRGWVVMITAVVVLLALLAILWPGFRSFTAYPTTAGWAAAVATASATFAALWISGQEQRRRRAHETLSRTSLTCILDIEAIDSITQRAQEVLSDINKIKWIEVEGTLGDC